MTVKITPRVTSESTSLPLGFEAGTDLTSGKSYVDASGNRTSKASLDKQLGAEGFGTHTVSISVEYRQPGTPSERPLERVTIRREVMGRLDTDTLGRVVHDSVRSVYDRLREQGTAGLGSLEGYEDEEEPDDFDAVTATGTPEEVFIRSITVA